MRISRWTVTAGSLTFALAAAPALAGQQSQSQHEHTSTSTSQENSNGKSSTIEGAGKSEFLRMAVQSDMAEIDLAKVAERNSSSQAVKQFAMRLQTDHSKDEGMVKKTAKAEHVTLPTSMSAEQHALKERLSGLKGPAFDREYIDAMIANHKRAVAAFKSEVEQASDPDVRAYAAHTLPVLQEHLELAEHTRDQLASNKS